MDDSYDSMNNSVHLGKIDGIPSMPVPALAFGGRRALSPQPSVLFDAPDRYDDRDDRSGTWRRQGEGRA